MSIFDDVVQIPRRVFTIFFVIDTSGNMAGHKIAVLNHAMEEFLPELKRISMENADAQIKIAVLKFDDSTEWITKNGPEEAETFVWHSLDAGGLANFGEACKALNEKLSTEPVPKGGRYNAPVIFLFSASEPTDNWQDELTKLKENRCFRWAVKAAVTIGDDANKDILMEFTGTDETVLRSLDALILKKMIKFTTVHIDPYELDIGMHKELNVEEKLSLLISVSIIDDGWEYKINAEVLSISPSRNYIICKSEDDKKMLILKYPYNSGPIFKSDVSFFAEIVNVSKIIWHESESYFDVYYDFPDKDQSRYLTQHICRYETKNFGHFEIENKSEPLDEEDIW